MSRWRLILDSLVFYARRHLAVALGVAAGTAVLTGALLVGDSVRGSLRSLALDRLGRVDAALVVDRFFRAELADELRSSPEFPDKFEAVVPCFLLQGTLERPAGGGDEPAGGTSRAGKISVIGCDSEFWALGSGGPHSPPAADEVVLNRALADELKAEAGDELILRVGPSGDIPADSPLGRKSEGTRNRRLTVAEVIPDSGLGSFGLRPNQQLPRNAYVAIETVRAMLEDRDDDRSAFCNALLVAGREGGSAPSEPIEERLQAALLPSLEDYGISIRPAERGYLNITTERMLLPEAVESAAHEIFSEQHPQSIFTYLANTIRAGEKEIPYSTITAMDLTTEPPWGPLLTSAGEKIESPGDDEIILNSWAAEELAAKPGDEIEVIFFEPETTHGEVDETSVKLRLAAIAELEGAAADEDLTPKLKGITDQLSMADWDPPFPYEGSRIREVDEQYWDEYQATPKAFVSLATGRRLWGSRFGDTTSVRFASTEQADASIEELERRFTSQLDPAELGFALRPVKRLVLTASSGTTPFHWLFVGFSMFIIAAAVMLVALLFRLGAEQRAAEVGILTAVGLRPRKVRGILALEGVAIAALASVVGVAAGVGYAWLMLTGLSTLWVEAITTPFLELYVTPMSLAIGYFAGVAVSSAAIFWGLWQMRTVSVRRLLAGRADEETAALRRSPRRPRIIATVLFAAAVGAAVAATFLSGEAQAGAFMGSGALVLAASLTMIWSELRAGGAGALNVAGQNSLARLALRNAARNPGRSTLTLGLVSSATFLIVAISAFRLEPPGLTENRDSGTGGFVLIAESAQPIYRDLNDRDALADLGVSEADRDRLQQANILSLRVRPGDDASCLNLYQTQQPRVLGLPQSFVRRGGFLWSATAAESATEQANPWLLLDRDPGHTDDGEPIVPVVLDQNTATYSLHIALGDEYRIDDGRGGEVVFQVVGLLKNSIFQGDLLVGEAPFRELFPEISGYQFFLAEAKTADADAVEQALETGLGDAGMDATRSDRRLAGFFAVQNTYLSTFQSLGGLGLLLGTFGLAAVQLRNVFERRSELALLRAAGFRRSRLAGLVLLENVVLLVGGLAVGVAAALVTVTPHWLAGGASVPWLSLVVTLGLVMVVGLLAASLAVQATLRAPLLAALRGE